MNEIAEDILMHYGMKYRSGRYPWGSGDDPYQHSGDFLSRVEELEKENISITDESGNVLTGEKAVARAMGMSTTDLRLQKRLAKHERRQIEVEKAKSMREDGKSLNDIAKALGYDNDSSVRSLLNEKTAARKNQAQVTADILEKELKEKRMIDIGAGAERELGISANTLKEASFILQTKGYQVLPVGIPEVTNPGKQINTPILCMPDVERKEPYQNMGDIKTVRNYHSVDGGKNFDKLEPPSSLDSSRVGIRYGDEGGKDKDGVIELRRGVKDLDLGNAHYAQVRIMVDGTHYLKGMAMYSDDIPNGVDVMFNTNKPSGTPKEKVMKKIKEDPDNPFGAYITAAGQSKYDDPNGKYTDPLTGKKQSLSPINKLKEEGDWDSMSKTLSQQFLSKQPKELIKRQLNLTYSDSADEFENIMSLTNPTVKKKLLLDFADQCDGAVVHLKAAALPRQKTQLLLPVTTLKDNEVYAPNFENGEKIALVRYPHAGTFEIPILNVNNKDQKAKDILGNATDAVGINPRVAERLSGADFDGDFVIAIPTNDKVRIKSSPPLKGLENFDPKERYSIPEGNPNHVKIMTKALTQKEMGKISNLITDMTLKGAAENGDDIAKAVRHSMVVIDAEKHKLDYKQSEIDNDIPALRKKYQGYIREDGKYVGGATTLLSRRKQTIDIPERKGSGRIDPATGKVIYKESGRTYIDKKTGEIRKATTKVHLLNEKDDIRTLSTGTPQEDLYADYANRMKVLANEARKAYIATPGLKRNSSASLVYKKEVGDLEARLSLAKMNAPREREANRLAATRIKAKIQEHPELNDKSNAKDLRKLKQQEIYNARNKVGASGKETRIEISDREWEAIQAGAISGNKLTEILRYADPDKVRELALPKTVNELSSSKVSKIKAMASMGYTNAEIAKAVGRSTSTVSKCINS